MDIGVSVPDLSLTREDFRWLLLLEEEEGDQTLNDWETEIDCPPADGELQSLLQVSV